jgi:hypothetical protein
VVTRIVIMSLPNKPLERDGLFFEIYSVHFASGFDFRRHVGVRVCRLGERNVELRMIP